MNLNVLGLIKSVEAFEREETEEKRIKSIQNLQSKAVMTLCITFGTYVVIAIIMSLM